jgi:hypothetical protein
MKYVVVVAFALMSFGVYAGGTSSNYKLSKTEVLAIDGVKACANNQSLSLPQNWVGTYAVQTAPKKESFYDRKQQVFRQYGNYKTVKVDVTNSGIKNVILKDYNAYVDFGKTSNDTRETAKLFAKANTGERYCYRNAIKGDRLSLVFDYRHEGTHIMKEVHLSFRSSSPIIDFSDVATESVTNPVAKAGMVAYKLALFAPVAFSMRDMSAWSQQSTQHLKNIQLMQVESAR